MAKTQTLLSDPQEQAFQRWYTGVSMRYGMAPNPDDPQHQYDWRKAFKAGVTKPVIDPSDGLPHWPSRFKKAGHPNRYVEGMDTMTDEVMHGRGVE